MSCQEFQRESQGRPLRTDDGRRVFFRTRWTRAPRSNFPATPCRRTGRIWSPAGWNRSSVYILNLRFEDEDIAFLKGLPVFPARQKRFFRLFKSFRFSGDVWAMPEGEVFFAREPILQVEAPVIEAQILKPVCCR